MFKKLITYILPINLLFDISLSFFEQGGVVPIIRALSLLALLFFFLIRYSYNNKYYSVGILFSAYILITCLFSTDIIRSLSITFKVVITVLSFGIGFNFFNSFNRLKSLNNSIIIMLVMLFLNFVISTIFDIGKDNYTGDNDFLAGNLDDSWNIYTYALLITPLIFLQYENQSRKKFLIQILAFTNLVIMTLSLKRIAFVGVVIGGLIYTYFNFNLFKNFKSLVIILLILVATFPIYESILLKRFDARSNRFEEGALESEARYLETGFVWSEIANFKNPLRDLFGLEGFKSVGNYADGKFGERNLHIDYNLIVNTVGVVGLILYLLIFGQFFNLRYQLRNAKNKIPPKLFKPLNGVFWAFILTQFVTSFAGQMYMTTFRMIIYIYLGAILGIMMRYSRESKEQNIDKKINI